MMAPKDHVERDILARKKTDLFVLCLALFVAVNCLSFFVRDGGRFFYTYHEGVIDIIGFPFLALAGCGGMMLFRWYGFFADLVIAFLVSWYVVRFHASKLPFLVREETVPLRYSMLSLFVLMPCMAVLLLVFYLVPAEQVMVRDCLFVLGPIVVGAVWSKYRHLSWSWLGVAGGGLFLLAVLAVFPYTAIADFSDLIPCIVQAFVPVAGILSDFVLLFTMFRLFRHMDTLAERARESGRNEVP